MSKDELKHKRKKAKMVCKRLIQAYGNIIHDSPHPPIDELVLTILSQHTSDVNAGRAFRQLKEDIPNWVDVMNAPEVKIAKSISSCGLYRLKAKRIKASLQEIHRRVGKLDLSILEDMELDSAKDWLTSLHGVGPKTAAIVLLFCFNRPVLPVDTHVWRVSKRLGLISDKTTREKAHILMEAIIPLDCIFSLNHNLVRHGRKVCKAQRPNCSDCFLSILCAYHLNKQSTIRKASKG